MLDRRFENLKLVMERIIANAPSDSAEVIRLIAEMSYEYNNATMKEWERLYPQKLHFNEDYDEILHCILMDICKCVDWEDLYDNQIEQAMHMMIINGTIYHDSYENIMYEIQSYLQFSDLYDEMNTFNYLMEKERISGKGAQEHARIINFLKNTFLETFVDTEFNKKLKKMLINSTVYKKFNENVGGLKK